MTHDKMSTVTLESSNTYPPATWRLLITPPLDGATNMAIDEAILYVLAGGHGIPTIRFFQWEPPCLSLGYNQHWSDVNEAACQQLGYTWTRRPTGGKAILHTDEITYSLIIPQADPRIQGGIIESYRILSLGLLRGLEKLGVQAGQARREDVRAQRKAIRTESGPVCFDTPSHYEITWKGKKLIGSAQLRRKQIVLQHGTLPLHGNLNRILETLTLSGTEYVQQAELLPHRATTLEQVLGKALSFPEVAPALAAGFAEQLNLTLAQMPLTDREQTLANELRAEQYANDRWNKRV
ncbi:MAG: lipoate--protein ligase family protein [Anaerolineae bacterium]|nr:lipoate--protein ligase family protein [Anaerolineae bacterium]